MASTRELKAFLEKEYHYVGTYQELAKNPRITSRQQAYDYDRIKEKIAKNRCTSADAFFVEKYIYFIEFKTGFAVRKSDVNARTHKENLELRIRLKAYESLCLFEKTILPDVGNGVLDKGIQKIYIAVIDSQEDPMAAYGDILAEKSGMVPSHKEEHHRIFENSLLNYRKTVKGGSTVIFYDRVEVWYDFEFDENVKKLK